MKILGFRRSDFTADDGNAITGYNVYVGTEFDPKHGAGMKTEVFYLTDAKLERNGIDIEELLDKDVRVYFNRWGKPDTIVLDD